MRSSHPAGGAAVVFTPKEAVFSSSEDRIRAARASVAVAGRPIVVQMPVLGIAGWASRAADSVFSVLFPSDCRICGEPLFNISRLPVCQDCLARIHPIEGQVCSICGERVLSAYAESDADGQRICPVCRRVERPFSRAVAYGSYDGELREMIHLLKYSGVRPAARVLGRLLAEAIASMASDFQSGSVLLIPVPLYKGKRRQRGFNQAELIARGARKVLANRERFELATDILFRTRETHSQIGLTSHQRRENLRGAFAVPRADRVNGREVLLVDDVYTTGTTVSECSQVLKRAGAARVWVATVARTLKLASKVEGFKIPEWPTFEEEPALPEAKMGASL
jgi:ComF family protein